MRRILSLQENFISQKSLLQEEIEKRGHKCIFYPKYHCELNFIEMYWGLQRDIQEINVIIVGLVCKKQCPRLQILSHSLITIRKFARKSWKYIDIYNKGVTGKLAEFAAKKYKSHRHVSDEVYNEIL